MTLTAGHVRRIRRLAHRRLSDLTVDDRADGHGNTMTRFEIDCENCQLH
jgi:hypothetical protein